MEMTMSEFRTKNRPPAGDFRRRFEHTPPAEGDDFSDAEWAEICDHLRRLDSEFLPEELAPHVRDLARGHEQIKAALNQLRRYLSRQRDNARLPAEQRSRVPGVCKTMTAPGEGAAWLERAVAAYKRGPEALKQFAEAERRAGRLV